MTFGEAAGWVMLAVFALAAVLFAIGLRRMAAASWAAWRLRRQTQPLRLGVALRREHGAYFQLRLRRSAWLRALPLPRFDAGMYLTLLGPEGASGRAQRRYSLAGWRRRPWAYELAIKREPGGLVSNWAAERLQAGQRVEVLAPAGSFLWPPAPGGEVVLVGAGIGVTPLRAMVQAWAAEGSTVPLTLVWSVRHRVELMDYDAEFRAMARQHPSLRYVPVLTGADGAWRGERGRVDAARVRAWCQTAQPSGFWMCASASMMRSLRDGLVAGGVADPAIHEEAFGAGANDDRRHYRVTLEPAGRELDFCGQPSLLALLQGAGEPVLSDCRNGTCGSCCVALRGGPVREVIAPEWAAARGQVLACCVVPAGDLVLGLPAA